MSAGLEGEPHVQAITADGSGVLVETASPLDARDTNGRSDLYLREEGRWTLITTGTVPQRSIPQFRLAAMSRDGRSVVFRTDDRLSSADTDDAEDLYASTAGQVRLLSTGPSGGNNGQVPTFHLISADGARTYFATEESLVPADRDAYPDLYLRESGVTRLLSLGDGAPASSFAVGRSEDGDHEYIKSAERLDTGDRDDCTDLYEYTGGSLSLLARDGAVGSACRDHDFLGATYNGAQVFYDEGGNGSIYRITCAATTTAVWPAPLPYARAELTGFTQDGAQAFITTDRQMTPQDTDAYDDSYRWDGGQYTLLSTGPAGGNGDFKATGRPSGDGRSFAFTTNEALTSDDAPMVGTTDPSNADVYLSTDSGTVLVSKGTGLADTSHQGFGGISQDGRRVLFAGSGLWEWVDGSVQLLTHDPSGAWAQVVVKAISEDLQHILFETNAALLAQDTDGIIDIYDSQLPARPSGPPLRPESPCPRAISKGTTALRLTSARVSPRRFRRGRRLPRVQTAARNGGRISFRLSERARVTLSFARRVKRLGRRVRYRSSGRFRIQARRGFNRIRFQGRLTKHKRLRPGGYLLTFRAIAPDGRRSNRARARFRLLRPGR